MCKEPSIRIDAAYLSACAPEAAYNWLKEKGAIQDADIPHVLEYILLRRRDDLIDLGLARYGRDDRVRQRIHDRGNVGIRCAVWQNPSTNPLREPTFWEEKILSNLGAEFYDEWNRRFPKRPKSIDAPVPIKTKQPVVKELVRLDRRAELQAIAGSVKDWVFENEVLTALMKRSGAFQGLFDETYRYCLVDIGKAKRLQRREEDWANGDSDYRKGLVIRAAWELTNSLPATEQWAEALFWLLESAPRESFEGAPEAIERWRIESLPSDHKEHGIYTLPYSLQLRSLIARTAYQKSDEAIFQRSNDLALRLIFYERFDPHEQKHENWHTFMKADGVPCFEALCNNIEIWETQSYRERLRKVGEHLDSRFPLLADCEAEYERKESIWKERRPEWFETESPSEATEEPWVERLNHIEQGVIGLALIVIILAAGAFYWVSSEAIAKWWGVSSVAADWIATGISIAGAALLWRGFTNVLRAKLLW